MCVQVILDGLHGDFGGQLVREAELSRGDAAEGDAFETVFFGTSHDVMVTGGQLFLLECRRNAIGNDGPDGMDDVLARQVVGFGDFGPPRRFRMPLLQHQPMTLLAQLHARRGMDGVVDASVQRVETAQHLCIGGVDDGVHAETGDVALRVEQLLFVKTRFLELVIDIGGDDEIVLVFQEFQQVVIDGFRGGHVAVVVDVAATAGPMLHLGGERVKARRSEESRAGTHDDSVGFAQGFP